MEVAPIFITVCFNNTMMTLFVSLEAQMTSEHLPVGPNRAKHMVYTMNTS